MPVSNLVDDRSGRPDGTQANKTPKPNKKETTIERENPLDSEIPEWLQEFRENLVDDEIPLQGGSHASSSHEASLEPTTKRREDLGKHSVKTHFPNWVASFRIWSRRSCHQSYGRAQTYGNQSDVLNSQKPSYVMLTFETKIHRLE